MFCMRRGTKTGMRFSGALQKKGTLRIAILFGQGIQYS